MVKITDEQVEFILLDLEKHGIILEDLRDNLLDHMCCIIENEMTESDNFYRFYESVLPRFFKQDLSEIQVETDNLLKFKNFYSMKKILKISGALTVLFTVIGAFFKTFHLPGAGITIVLGGFLFSLVFLPLLIALKFRDEESKTDKFVFAFGFLVAITIFTGLIFKLMHWPGATMLMLGGTVTFTFIYVPIYFFTRYRRAELKFNTIVNSVLMMACGGILFSLFNLSYSYKYEGSMEDQNLVMHKNSLRIYESNERLLDSVKDSTAQNLHLSTINLDQELTRIVESIVDDPKHSAIDNDLQQLKEKVKAYNVEIKNVQDTTIREVEVHPIEVMPKLHAKVKITILTKIQQQIAINENYYLTKL